MMKKDMGTFIKFITALRDKNQHEVADCLQNSLGTITHIKCTYTKENLITTLLSPLQIKTTNTPN